MQRPAVSWWRLVLMAAAVASAACGGSTDSGSDPGPKISKKAVVLDSTKAALVPDSAAQANGTYTFNVSSTHPIVSPGDVIVGAEGGGYLRRVNTVQAAAGQLVLETSDASLTDIVTEGSVTDTITLDLASQSPALGTGGVQWGALEVLGPDGKPLSVRRGGVSLNGTVLFENASTKVTLSAGNIEFSPKFVLDMHIKEAQVNDLVVSATGNLTFDATLQVNASAPLASLQLEKTVFTLKRSFLFFIGAVPVAGVARLDFMGTLGLGMNGAVIATTGLLSTQSVTVGAQYGRSSSPQWSPVWSATSTFTPQPLTFSAPVTASAEAGGKVQLTLTLYGVLGPNMYAGAKGVFATTADFAQGTLNTKCTAKVYAGLGLDFKVLSYALAKLSATKDLYSHDFCNRSDPIPGATTIALLSGNGQTGPIGSTLGVPLQVKVTDGGGAGVGGVSVVFAVTGGGGSLGGLPQRTVSTNNQGIASVSLTLGPSQGTNTVTATATGLTGSPVTFTETAVAPSLNMVMVSGNNQTGATGATLPNPLRVAVTDQNANPVSGVPVTFTATQGAGNFGGQPSILVNTNGAGLAEAIYTLGAAAGTNTVSASSPGVSGSPVIFTETATGSGRTLKFQDDFSAGLTNWTENDPDGLGSWVIQNGEVVGDYDIGCGVSSCNQIQLLLTAANQPTTANWRVEVDMDSAVAYNQPGFQAIGALAKFSLFVSNSQKAAIDIGKSVSGLTLPANFTSVTAAASSYPWASIGTGTVNVTWDPRVKQTAALEKIGDTYTVFFNGQQVLQFSKVFSVPPKVGLHTYGRVRMDNFRLYECGQGC